MMTREKLCENIILAEMFMLRRDCNDVTSCGSTNRGPALSRCEYIGVKEMMAMSCVYLGSKILSLSEA